MPTTSEPPRAARKPKPTASTKGWREIRQKRTEQDGPAFEEGVARERERTTHEIAVYEQSLRDLRRARSLTQITLAKTLGVDQSQVSRIENEADLYLSTLQSYIDALGGELELVGVFDDERFVIKLSDATRKD